MTDPKKIENIKDVVNHELSGISDRGRYLVEQALEQRINRLPEIEERITAIEKRVEILEKRSGQDRRKGK